MSLDLSSLEKALESLGRAISRSIESPRDEELRDAVIQRFEYSYELCWKMLKRRLEAEHPSPAEVDSLSFHDLLREAAERGLIDDVESWMDFRESRNITSHTYDRKKAEAVHKSALEFAPKARSLLCRLHERNK
ncbi:MAG: nucleotidyltransferase substrate binding protein [Elusimicrobia bacterium]|nr:nucleotidyltransferase substrate binding protein [Elusimicrobiota bacterium]